MAVLSSLFLQEWVPVVSASVAVTAVCFTIFAWFWNRKQERLLKLPVFTFDFSAAIGPDEQQYHFHFLVKNAGQNPAKEVRCAVWMVDDIAQKWANPDLTPFEYPFVTCDPLPSGDAFEKVFETRLPHMASRSIGARITARDAHTGVAISQDFGLSWGGTDKANEVEPMDERQRRELLQFLHLA